MEKRRIKVCFAASSGGHYEQLLMLRPLMERYDSFIVTERTACSTEIPGIRTLYLQQVNRREPACLPRLAANTRQSLKILREERPDVVISTGVLATIPLCLLAKLYGKQLIYIESFAKLHSPTRTGKLLYHFADRFYVQWESMLQVYPRARFLGSMY